MSDQRKYCLDEIDAMRKSVMTILMLRTGGVRDPDTRVEEQLRTYMLAGISPDELVAKAKTLETAWDAREMQRLRNEMVMPL